MTKDEVTAMFDDDVEKRKRAVRAFVMDKSNAYEDRLEVWRKTPKHLHTNNAYILHLPKFEAKHGEVSWYDDFYVERYTEVILSGVDQRGAGGYWSEEKVREFCEECMDLGYHSFTYDW